MRGSYCSVCRRETAVKPTFKKPPRDLSPHFWRGSPNDRANRNEGRQRVRVHVVGACGHEFWDDGWFRDQYDAARARAPEDAND